MVRKVHSAELGFESAFLPAKKLREEVRGKLWQNILRADFQKSLGNPEVQHVNKGYSGESHVSYNRDGISIVAYDDGKLRVEAQKFRPEQGNEIELIVKSFIQLVNRTAKRKVSYNVNLRLHADITEPSVKKFLSQSIRFAATPELLKAIGHFKGIRSFVLRVTDDFNLVFFYPAHVDFLYTISGSIRKHFVASFVTRSLKYLQSMEKHA